VGQTLFLAQPHLLAVVVLVLMEVALLVLSDLMVAQEGVVVLQTQAEQ
jgi:hypothetical protein